MTKYYFYTTNADNGILATNGTYFYNCAIDSDGNDITTGVNIYRSNLDALRKAYSALHDDGLLYDFSDIERDFSDKIYLFNPDDFENLELIIEFDNETPSMYRIIVRDNEGSIINEYRDSAKNEQEMYDRAAEEWRIDERGGWIDVQAEQNQSWN